MITTTKSELLGRGVWELAAELLSLPVWESYQLVDPIELDYQQAALLGLDKLQTDSGWRETNYEGFEILENIRRIQRRMMHNAACLGMIP